MVLPYLGTALEQTYSVGVALLARPLARSPTLVIHAVGTRSRVEAQLQAFHAAVGRQPVVIISDSSGLSRFLSECAATRSVFRNLLMR